MRQLVRLALPALAFVLAAPTFAAESKQGTPTVTIEAFQFSPSELKIPVGTTVTFLNKDSTPHTVTPKTPGSFTRTGRIVSGASRTVTFEKAGTFHYFCEIHTTMTGSVRVQ